MSRMNMSAVYGFDTPCPKCGKPIGDHPLGDRCPPMSTEADIDKLIEQLREKALWREDIHHDLHIASADLITKLRAERDAAARALSFYADPFAWKAAHDPDDDISVPDFYSETNFGDTAAEALSVIATEERTNG